MSLTVLGNLPKSPRAPAISASPSLSENKLKASADPAEAIKASLAAFPPTARTMEQQYGTVLSTHATQLLGIQSSFAGRKGAQLVFSINTHEKFTVL